MKKKSNKKITINNNEKLSSMNKNLKQDFNLKTQKSILTPLSD